MLVKPCKFTVTLPKTLERGGAAQDEAAAGGHVTYFYTLRIEEGPKDDSKIAVQLLTPSTVRTQLGPEVTLASSTVDVFPSPDLPRTARVEVCHFQDSEIQHSDQMAVMLPAATSRTKLPGLFSGKSNESGRWTYYQITESPQNPYPLEIDFEVRWCFSNLKQSARRSFMGSEEEPLEMKASLLEDAATSGDLNLICKVSSITLFWLHRLFLRAKLRTGSGLKRLSSIIIHRYTDNCQAGATTVDLSVEASRVC